MDTVTLLYSTQLIIHKSGAVAADIWQIHMSVMSVMPVYLANCGGRTIHALLNQVECLHSEFLWSASLLWFAKNPVAIW
jgi:hypothetical protein